jgi:hypothetical protein
MRFRPPAADIESQRVFRYPLAAAIKMAVFSDCLRVPREYLHFRESARPKLDELGVSAIAAPASAIADLLTGWRATHPIVVFTGPDYGVLTQDVREVLWNQSQVPLFEQLVSTDRIVIARECDAHAGLHLDPANLRPRGIQLHTVSGLCGCGTSGVRVLEWSAARRGALLIAPALPAI